MWKNSNATGQVVGVDHPCNRITSADENNLILFNWRQLMHFQKTFLLTSEPIIIVSLYRFNFLVTATISELKFRTNIYI